MRNNLVFFIFSTITFLSWAQKNKIVPTVFDKSDGFELSYVSSIVSDNDGFLWLSGKDLEVRDILGSNKKLAIQRFNGRSFDNITIPHSKGRVTEVNQLYKRDDGMFYVRFGADQKSQIALFDPITTEFTFVDVPKPHSAIESISPFYKFEGKNYLLLHDGEKITFSQLQDDLSFKNIFSFNFSVRKISLVDARIIFTENRVIITDDNLPVLVFDWKGKLIREFVPADFGIKNLKSHSETFIDEHFVHNNRFYFFLKWNPQLYTLDLDKLEVGKTDEFRVAGDNFHLLQQGNEVLIIDRNKYELGLYKLGASKNNRLEIDTINFNEEFGSRAIQRAYSRDLTNELWLVTEEQQLLHYSIEEKPIKSVLIDCSIRALHPLDTNKILVATENDGWYLLNYKTKQIKQFPLHVNGEEVIAISSRAFIKNGQHLWTSNSAGVLQYNLDTKDIFESKLHPVGCIAKRGDSQLVYGTNHFKLLLYDTPSAQHHTLLETDSLNIIDVKVYKDWVIAGTDKGLLLYQFSSKKHKLIQTNSILSDRYILSVSELGNGVYLLGTQQGLLIHFDVKTQKLKLMYEDELKAGIASVLIDDKKQWWISTFNGIVCFNPLTKARQRYSNSDGLSNNEGNRYSSLKMGEMLFFGSLKGLNYFSVDKLRPDADSAELCLMKSEVFDEEWDAFRSNMNRTILKQQTDFTLPAVQRSLRLHFAIKNGSINGKYIIHYRLDKGRWVTLDQSNDIYFSNLAPGTYDLEVELLNFSGKLLGKRINYSVVVNGFFYEQVWFYILLLLTGVFLIVWYMFEQRQQRLLREKFSEDLIVMQEAERARISIELHDSVGQQLTLLKKTAQNRDQTDLSELANHTLEEVRAISKHLHPPLLKELGLTESIRTLIHAFDEETDLFFTEDLDNIDAHFNETEALHLYRFVQEGLSNMLKHAQAKSAIVEIKIVGKKFIHIVIEDNGIGIKSGTKSFSLGMTTMQERIRILNGIFTIEKLHKGTRLLAKITIT